MKKILSVLLAFCTVMSLSSMAFAASLRGDVDGDGKVSSSDALLILQYSVGIKKTIDKNKADLNGDGAINSADALTVLQISVGIIFTVPTTKDGIVDLYNSALKKAYYSDKLTLDKTHYDRGKIENLTNKTSENFNDNYNEKLTFYKGVSNPYSIPVETFAPGCNIDVNGVASATVTATSSGYKLVITLKQETTDIFSYPVYNKQAFGFAYTSSEAKSGTTKYTGTVFTLEIDNNGNAKALQVSMPYVCEYVAVISGKNCNMRDSGEEYFSSKLVY